MAAIVNDISTGPSRHARLNHGQYMGLSGTALRTVIGLTAGLCFVSFGYGQGEIGGLLVVDTFRTMFPVIDIIGSTKYHVATIGGA